MTSDDVVAKGEFARLCNVVPGRVTQWITAGKISGEALVGVGRSARIRVAVAQAQLKRHLDPNQMTANGVRTRLPTGPLIEKSAPIKAEPVEKPEPDYGPDFASTLKKTASALDLTEERARLAKEQADHAALKNAALRGEMILADQAERRWADEMVAMKARMLAVSGDLPSALPHLTAYDVATIDRAIRDAMAEAADVRPD